MKGPLYHICTKEDHSIIFRTDFDFKAGINILAICLMLHHEIELYAFALMSNHFHFLIGGNEAKVRAFFEEFVRYLSQYFSAEKSDVDLEGLSPKFFPVETQDYCRSVISYINRNPAVANPAFTVVNYEFGSGRFFFNPEAERRYRSCRKPLTITQIRQFSHSRKFDKVQGLYEIDGYVSPLCFCNVKEAQSVFSSPRQYMYYISKNIEATKDIAAEIGESITFSDYDLYGILPHLTKEMFGAIDSRTLNPDEKIRLAKRLHFDYNAGNKQICRILKIDLHILNALFQQ